MLRLKTFGGLVVHRDGRLAEGARGQRRRIAILALLAAAGDAGVGRERILTTFWPDTDTERAGKYLTDAVDAIQRDLDTDEMIIGREDLRLNPEIIQSDVAEFRAAVRMGRLEAAVALYEGPFLDEVHLDEPFEFKQWAEQERASLARDFAEALSTMARQATDRADHRTAAGYWRRLANADRLNGTIAGNLMRALAALRDRPGALAHFRVYEALLRQERDEEPSLTLKALAEELREAEAAAPSPPPKLQPEPPPAGRPSSPGQTDEYARPRPLPNWRMESGSHDVLSTRPSDPQPLPSDTHPLPSRRRTGRWLTLGLALALIGAVIWLLVR